MSFTHIKHAVYGSLVGGVVFGIMMGMMGMLPMIGAMVGSPSAVVGFGVHLAISATIGIGFAFLVSVLNHSGGVTAGLAYGFAWWILGPLMLMPLFMGMGLGANWTLSAIAGAIPSLIGHLVFGGLLGATYRWLQTHETAVTTARQRTT